MMSAFDCAVTLQALAHNNSISLPQQRAAAHAVITDHTAVITAATTPAPSVVAPSVQDNENACRTTPKMAVSVWAVSVTVEADHVVLLVDRALQPPFFHHPRRDELRLCHCSSQSRSDKHRFGPTHRFDSRIKEQIRESSASARLLLHFDMRTLKLILKSVNDNQRQRPNARDHA